MLISLGIVIPSWNAQATLLGTLTSLKGDVDGLKKQILVVDAGSSDGFVPWVIQQEVKCITSQKGRGVQMALGAGQVEGDWLLFLHSDTQLQPGWESAVLGFIRQPKNRTMAAVFTFALDSDHLSARRIEWWVNLRVKGFSLPYGDQGLLLHRSFYEQLGGFKTIPLMEDVDMVRRIGRKRLTVLPTRAITSPIRYQRHGYWLRPLFHMVCLMLYFFGVSPHFIARIYR